MPRIWFSRSSDVKTLDGFEHRVLTGRATFLAAGWRLVPGSHLLAEAGYITRRFISSSIWRDTITQLKPSYYEQSFFPITTTNSVQLPASNMSVATGTIEPSRRPQFAAFKDRSWFDSWKLDNSDSEMCDYIEDYRTGTILSALGSVGGLFALLQSLHLFFFGRPMLWGLT
ncbi:hypothetical protein FRC08_010267, partial [Ceratobasidium sp. 394]